MFDAETARLISSAQPLDGLDLERLPQFLTSAYALVIEARLKAGSPGQGDAEDGYWSETVSRLKALADTYEGLTIFLERENAHREACAFVAASAHLALNQIRRLRGVSGEAPIPSLTRHAVSPEVAACLLFLVGGHQAEASEATKAFVSDGSTNVGLVLDGLAALSSGHGERIRGFSRLPRHSAVSSGIDYIEVAAQALWSRLALAIQLHCQLVLGEPGCVFRRIVITDSAAS